MAAGGEDPADRSAGARRRSCASRRRSRTRCSRCNPRWRICLRECARWSGFWSSLPVMAEHGIIIADEQEVRAELQCALASDRRGRRYSVPSRSREFTQAPLEHPGAASASARSSRWWIALSAANAKAAGFSLLVYAAANLIVYTDALDFILRLFMRRRHRATMLAQDRYRRSVDRYRRRACRKACVSSCPCGRTRSSRPSTTCSASSSSSLGTCAP